MERPAFQRLLLLKITEALIAARARHPHGGDGRRRVRAHHNNVTDQARREDALRFSEQRLAFALDSGGDGVWTYDCTRDHIGLAGRWWSILGYGEDEVEPTPAGWHALTHPDDRDRVRNAMIDHLRGRSA